MRVVVLLSLLALLAAAAPALAAEGDAEARYQALLAVAEAGDRPVDWQALRFAYADRPSFNVADDGLDVLRRSMRAAVGAGNFENALAEARLIFEQDYVDAEAHFGAALAYAKLGQTPAAIRERDIGAGLLKSIETGDGKSARSAYTVINVAEEYGLMSARGRRVMRQSLVRADGHAYDVLETVDETGAAQSYYFLIDRVMAAEIKAFRPKP